MSQYSLKTDGNEGRESPCRWVLEGSNNSVSWRQIDYQNTYLKGSYVTKTYKFSNSLGMFFRYLRFHQIGVNQSGAYRPGLSAIEFFGTVRTDRRAAALRMKRLREEEQRRQRGEFRICDDRPFWGIIAHLSAEFGGNVDAKGVVNIMSSSDEYNCCRQVTDYGWNDYWCTKNEGNSWLCFDFKDKKVRLTNYSLKSGGAGRHFVEWVVEGSDDGCSWRRIDRRCTHGLNGNYITKTYECCGSVSESFRYLALRVTGKDSSGHHSLCLSEIEFFGELCRNSK